MGGSKSGSQVRAGTVGPHRNSGVTPLEETHAAWSQRSSWEQKMQLRRGTLGFSARKLFLPVELRRQTVSFPSLEGSNLKMDNKLTGRQAND